MKETLRLWVTWRARQQEGEIKRACGVKSSGIEYRIMLEGKAALIEPGKKFEHEELCQACDLVWYRLWDKYPQEMEAIKVYAYHYSFRQVRMTLGISQHTAKKAVLRGMDLFAGGLAVVTGLEK